MGFAFFGSLDFGGVLFGTVGCGGRSRKSATLYGIWLYREGFAKRQFGVSVGIFFLHPNGMTLGNQSASVEDFLYCITGQPLSST